MSTDALSELRSALANGDLAQSVKLIDAVDDAIDRQSEREQALRSLARGVLARTQAGSDVHQTARQFVRAMDDAERHRLEFGYWLLALTEGSAEPQNLLDVTDTLIEDRDAVNGEATKLRERGKDVPIPPLLAAFSPAERDVPKGKQVAFDVSVENVGTELVEEVDVSLDTEFNLGVSASSVGNLSPSGTKTVTVSGTPTAEGSDDVVVTFGTDEVDETARTILTVADKSDYLSHARELIADLVKRVGELDDGSGGGSGSNGNGGNGGVDGLLNKLQTIDKRLATLAEKAEKGRPNVESLNNQITSAINQLGAFINQTEALGSEQLSANTATVLAQDAGEVISTLDYARKANV